MEQLTIEDFYLFSEGQDVECKAAQGKDGQGELPKDFWPTYSAMANTTGGVVWLGIAEKGNAFIPIGIKNIDRIKKDLFSTINNTQKVSCNLLKDSNFSVIDVDGLEVIRITIPRARCTSKLYG